MWANRRLASVSVRGDDPNMSPGQIFAARRLRRTAKRIDSFYWGSGLSDDVPALAWYLVGACVPLTLGIAALAALVLGDGARAEQVATRLASVLPPGARDEVIDLVLRTHRNSPLLLAIAVASMVWAGVGATGVVERVESRLLGAPRLGPIALKLRHLGLAAGMVLMIALMAAAGTEATNLRGRLSFPIPGWVLSVASAMLIAAICSLLYRYATTRRISWGAALRGGIPAAVVLELTPLVAGYYARAVAGRTPVQVFLALRRLAFSRDRTLKLLELGLQLPVLPLENNHAPPLGDDGLRPSDGKCSPRFPGRSRRRNPHTGGHPEPRGADRVASPPVGGETATKWPRGGRSTRRSTSALNRLAPAPHHGRRGVRT